jgi:hypothetical protein
VGSVEKQLEVVAVRNFLQAIYIARPPPSVNANNSSGTRGYHLFNLIWIDEVRFQINITKDRGNLLPLQRMGGCHESEGRHNNFPS